MDGQIEVHRYSSTKMETEMERQRVKKIKEALKQKKEEEENDGEKAPRTYSARHPVWWL